MPKLKGPEPTTPGVALATPEQQLSFCETIIEEHGVKPACKLWGLKSAAVFYLINSNPEFRNRYMVAKRALQEDLVEGIQERNERLLAMDPKDMNLCANAYRCANEQELRMLGILNRSIFGEKPTQQVNIQNNTAVLVDEETRQRIMDLRKQILLKPVEATLLPNVEEKPKPKESENDRN